MKLLQKACNVRNTGGKSWKVMCRRNQPFWRSRRAKQLIGCKVERTAWAEYDGLYSPAAVISHHQQQQAVTSARAPAISEAAHDTRALAGRPGGLSAARSMLARASRTRTLRQQPRPAPGPPPAPRSPRATISRVSSESARAALFSGGSLTAPNWLGPFTCRTCFRSVQPQSLAPLLTSFILVVARWRVVTGHVGICSECRGSFNT